MEIFGIIASILFIKGAIWQAVKCWREGHAAGISHSMIWSLLLGFLFMGTHVCAKFGWDSALMSSYIIQGICFVVIAKYKYFSVERGNGRKTRKEKRKESP